MAHPKSTNAIFEGCYNSSASYLELTLPCYLELTLSFQSWLRQPAQKGGEEGPPTVPITTGPVGAQASPLTN